MPEPVLVSLRAKDCGHCQKLSSIWTDVTTELRKSYPNLRYFVLELNSMRDQLDVNTAPKGLTPYTKWYPMILLVPGGTWDAAMANLGPKNPIEIKTGVQVMNASWNADELSYGPPKYDIRKKEDFVRWMKDSLDNDEFKRANSSVNNGIQKSPLIVPTTTNPIQPLIPIKNKSVNSYAASNDTCNIKIIPRDR